MYVTDSMRGLPRMETTGKRWVDIVGRHYVETKSAEEIIGDLTGRGAFTIESA